MNSTMSNAVVPFYPDCNCGDFAIIEQDAPATLKPIEIERFAIIETIEAQP